MVVVRLLGKVVAQLSALFDLIVAASMFAMMVIVMCDVTLRYLFNAPLPWAFDLITWILMPAVFFFSLASTLQHRQHINIDVLFRKARGTLRRLLVALGALLSAALFGLIAYLGALRAHAAFVNGETMSGELQWPTWVYIAFIPVGVGLLVLALLLRVGGTESDANEAPAETGPR